jgi:hypothetical protein
MKKTLGLVLLGLLVFAPVAGASTVLCPSTIGIGIRNFSLTTDPAATCLAYGPGNVDNTWGATSGWTLLDKSDDVGSGSNPGWLTVTPPTSGLSGVFAINASVWATYGRAALALKSGDGQLDPDYAVFELSKPTDSGSWTISGQQALSHVNLYGLDRIETPPVPEPATMLLLGTGLLGSSFFARRRKK